MYLTNRVLVNKLHVTTQENMAIKCK